MFEVDSVWDEMNETIIKLYKVNADHKSWMRDGTDDVSSKWIVRWLVIVSEKWPVGPRLSENKQQWIEVESNKRDYFFTIK